MAAGWHSQLGNRAQISSASQSTSEGGVLAYQADRLIEELTEFILNFLFWLYIIYLCLSNRNCSLDLHGKIFEITDRVSLSR